MFHCLSCESTAAFNKIRHDKIANVIHTFISRFCNGVVSQTEEQYHCSTNGQKKKIDVIISVGDCTFYIDVSIFNPGCPSHARVKDESSRECMSRQEDIKRSQYEDVFLSNHPNLIPFIIDTTGNLGPCAVKFLSDMEDHCNSNIMKSKFLKAFLTCISVCLCNGLASSSDAFFRLLDEKMECLVDDAQDSISDRV